MLGCYGEWHDSPKEEDMHVMKFISLAAILATVVALVVAQQTQTPPTYCAVCHGKDGKGNSPAASAMKTSPADLTVLAQNNGGKYPAAHVAAVIR
jgi:mono/diheme cytochrome c family protein